ncbi:MAG: hypothetical protein ACTIOL_04850 [Enterococcus sp.]
MENVIESKGKDWVISNPLAFVKKGCIGDKRDYFDAEGKSALWSLAFSMAKPFAPLEIQEIDLLMQLPVGKGSLILSGNTYYRSEVSPLETLQMYAEAYSFSNYHQMSTCLQSFGCFGKYMSPWICPFFTLCPLESIERAIWVNPLKIQYTETVYGELIATLTSGERVLFPIQRRSLVGRLERACLALATLRRECFYFTERSKSPTHYLPFPNNSFSRTLSNRALLQTFPISHDELLKHFNRISLCDAYEAFDPASYTHE